MRIPGHINDILPGVNYLVLLLFCFCENHDFVFMVHSNVPIFFKERSQLTMCCAQT